MRPVLALGVAGAGADIGTNANADVGVGIKYDNGKDDGTDSSGIAPP